MTDWESMGQVPHGESMGQVPHGESMGQVPRGIAPSIASKS